MDEAPAEALIQAVRQHIVDDAENILIENQMVNRALTGVYNPTVSIFLMKNNFGYVDKQEQEIKVSEKSKAEKLSETLFDGD